jgi:hypothetical protein
MMPTVLDNQWATSLQVPLGGAVVACGQRDHGQQGSAGGGQLSGQLGRAVLDLLRAELEPAGRLAGGFDGFPVASTLPGYVLAVADVVLLLSPAAVVTATGRDATVQERERALSSALMTR